MSTTVATVPTPNPLPGAVVKVIAKVEHIEAELARLNNRLDAIERRLEDLGDRLDRAIRPSDYWTTQR